MLWLVRTTPGAYDTGRSLRSPSHRLLGVYGAYMLRGLLLTLLLVLTACGSSSGDEDGPSKSALACRDKWKDLESKVGGRDTKTNPSDLAARWNSIAATVDYYASSASGNGCGSAIEEQSKAMDDLAKFSAQLAPYDMELRLDEVKADAEAYAAAPRPPAPSPSPAKKGKKKAKKAAANPAPKPADIAAALKALTTQAPLATQQQGPAWQQARVAELSDDAAVAKAVKDLAFLSSESPAYAESNIALVQIEKAQASQG